jgi:hypothetical protein
VAGIHRGGGGERHGGAPWGRSGEKWQVSVGGTATGILVGGVAGIHGGGDEESRSGAPRARRSEFSSGWQQTKRKRMGRMGNVHGPRSGATCGLRECLAARQLTWRIDPPTER